MIELEMHADIRDKNVRRCRERGITLPTFNQMKDPSLVPDEIRQKLAAVGLWDLDPLNRGPRARPIYFIAYHAPILICLIVLTDEQIGILYLIHQECKQSSITWTSVIGKTYKDITIFIQNYEGVIRPKEKFIFMELPF